jgi:hypothetical protein
VKTNLSPFFKELDEHYHPDCTTAIPGCPGNVGIAEGAHPQKNHRNQCPLLFFSGRSLIWHCVNVNILENKTLLGTNEIERITK